MAQAGWRRIRGKGPRRYRDPQGVARTEYAYRNARAKAAGWGSYYDYRKTSESNRYYIQARTDAIIDRGLGRRQTGMTSEFAEKYTKQRNIRTTDPDYWHDPEGPGADFLVYIGRRKETDTWDVGETPQLKRNGG